MAAEGRIEVRLGELAQLFNTLDPSPFHSRDLDGDAEEYIVGSARELPRDRPLAICIQLPAAEAEKALKRDVAGALANYFGYRADVAGRELRETMRNAWRALGIGLTVLALCLVASQLAGRALDPHPLGRLVEEGLIILGWVANWRPLEMFLYDRGHLARRRDLMRRIAAARVEVRPA